MKVFQKVLIILAYSAFILSAATPASPEARAKAICGDLGILDITTVPDGVEPSELRLCANHPMGRNRNLDPKKGASLAPGGEGYYDDITPADSANLLSERFCSYSAPYGCEGKWCWKTCGNNGQWCWTAWAKGTGAWRGCKTWRDCGTDNTNYGCGKNCNVPGNCGCSC
ncbi:uncharacterized protein FTOL_13510 [Fusarium torulosum]|uniref:IDI-2 n=1 Tax=Fusarium torulosum TaxID=33205 RepID=A0AAE8MMM7_9HYPO|nr:uncharacterized protein FTOL_13510 [Fusarium torulosum]